MEIYKSHKGKKLNKTDNTAYNVYDHVHTHKTPSTKLTDQQ